MIRRPPRSTRTDTLFPYTTLFRSLINMFHGGKTPLVGSDRLGELGYSLVIIPSDTQRAAIQAMQETLAAIARDGHSGALPEHMVSFHDREELIGTSAYLERDQRYSACVPPPGRAPSPAAHSADP